jgi:hypothetical protein
MVGKSADEPSWRAAMRCDTGACVEIGTLGKSVLVRGSTDPGGRYVAISLGEWQQFVARVKDGEFDGLWLGRSEAIF